MTSPPLGIPVVSAAEIDAAVSRRAAVEAIMAALRDGWDIEHDHERLFAPLAGGEFLLMPAESAASAGIKVATIAPGNTTRGLPKIHAWYLLFDRETLQPRAVLEGARLTTLRTPAVTAVAIEGLLAADPDGARTGVEHLVVVGSGPQAVEHARTLAAIAPVRRVSIVGRRPVRVEAAVAELRAAGLPADRGSHETLAEADVVITATSSSTPVVELDDVRPDAVVAAIGSHGHGHREVGERLVRSADIVVEARASALRENGNLSAARSGDEWTSGANPIWNLAELVRGEMTRRPGAPALYTGVGMAWEDLAVVERIMETTRQDGPLASEEAYR
ncbi:ornithine cyclodeaminase family protein [Microbacterium yannicii]|uniref:ornithine cyclodeaminase family protein n=1 Tax=Microbacterium yannicii TaxID=671622 RepID=UPI0002FA8769|nr:ornithine cyclodeaminase family protein [Microbacterium yannicii]